MAQQHEYVGVFSADCEHDEPIALFVDADEAQRYRRGRFGDRGLVAPVEASPKLDSSVRDAVKALHPTPVPNPTEGAQDDVRKGEIRARIEAEERDKALEAEVRRELAEEHKQTEAERKADESKPVEPNKPGR